MEERTFSQESMSLLLAGGNTGVSLEHHLPTSSFALSPVDVVEKLERTATEPMYRMPSGELFTSSPLYTSGQIPYPQTVDVQSVTTVESTVGDPIRTDQFPGGYNFNIEFEEKENYTKNHPNCYNRENDIVIVKQSTPIAFTFTALHDIRPMKLRVLACYSKRSEFQNFVEPCHNCVPKSQGTLREFLRCSNENSTSFVDTSSGRQCVLVPLDRSRDLSGDGTRISENFIFTCKTSCNMKSGNEGIKGRKVSLIFQIERCDGYVMGRRVVSLKVSTSPGRDLTTMLKARARKRSSLSEPETAPVAKKQKIVVPIVGTGKYSVVVKGLAAFKFSQRIANLIDAQFDSPNQGSDWADYMGTDPSSQMSVATQENGSQSSQYTLEGWLGRYGLQQYAAQLEQSGFGSPTQFQCLQEKDLDAMRILDLCHRNTLLHAAKRVVIRGIEKMVKDES